MNPALSLHFDDLPSFVLVNETAAKSRDKKGACISAGKKMTRLKIGNDSRFWIAAKKLENAEDSTASWKKICKISIKVKLGENSFALLNINSLRTRFHLKKIMFKNLHTSGQLLACLHQRAQEVSDAVLAYEKFLLNKFRLPPPLLMKVAWAVAKILKSPPPPCDGRLLHVQSNTFIARCDKNARLKLYQVGKLLGTGSFGVVNVVTALHKNQEYVFKKARKDIEHLEKAKLDIEKEYRMLCRIHAHGKIVGIQEKPKAMITMTQDGIPVVGYLGKKYDHDYFNYYPENNFFYHRVMEFQQLLTGLKYLEEQGIIHGDIKRENIFVKTVGNKKWIYLADFGDARDTQFLPTEEVIPGTCTIECRTMEDRALFTAFVEQNKKSEAVELGLRMDVFAMGIAFYEALTGISPFREIGNNIRYPDLSTFDAETLRIYGVPCEIQTLITKMLHPDYQQRISATQALWLLETFIRKNVTNTEEKAPPIQPIYAMRRQSSFESFN